MKVKIYEGAMSIKLNAQLAIQQPVQYINCYDIML